MQIATELYSDLSRDDIISAMEEYGAQFNEPNSHDESELLMAAEPLLKYLQEKHHPHTTALVTGNSIELVEGIMSVQNIEIKN